MSRLGLVQLYVVKEDTVVSDMTQKKRGETDKKLRDEENCFSADTPCISSIQWRDSSALFCVSRASKDGAAMREKKKRKKELKRFFSREKCADPAQQKRRGRMRENKTSPTIWR